jgi:hypothetical protein
MNAFIDAGRILLCIVCINIRAWEVYLNIDLYLTYVMQLWLVFEWLGTQTRKKCKFDPVLDFIVPFLSQMIVFYKLFCQ